MSTSPPIEVKGANPEVNERPKLAYVAEIFKTTLRAKPLATLDIVTDSHTYFNSIQQALVNLGVFPSKIVPLVITKAYLPTPIWLTPGSVNPFEILNKKDWASLMINYQEGRLDKQRITVEFKPDDQSPFEIDFEASPDGTMLSEVEVEWSTPLKKVVADSAGMGVRQVKFATKIKGLAGFDRKTVTSIETELKVKLHQSLSFFLKIKGNEHLKIQFYGEIGVKYGDDKVKPFAEGGVLFEVPFDIADIFK